MDDSDCAKEMTGDKGINLDAAFELLSSEMKDLYPSVETLNSVPDSLTFYRKYVSQNRPVVIKNVISHWPALRKWNEKYFRDKVGNQLVTVAVTPNGYADAIYQDHFVMPEERKMLVSEFMDIVYTPLEKRNVKGVFYIQKQNSNLYDEFSELMGDVDPHISWGTQAFGSEPDAVNFWMGDENAVTSKTYPAAVYKENADGEFEMIKTKNGDKVSWIAVDPLKPDLKKYPQYAKARPLTVVVKKGETLYLPSLWFHHVQQSQACIAVNYWYDMDFDIKWAYYKFLEKLKCENNVL